MKRLLTILTIICFVFSLGAQQKIALSSAGNRFEIKEDGFSGFKAAISYDAIYAADEQAAQRDFSRLFIDGAFSSGEIGAPELPVFKKLIAVPVGAQPKVILRNYSVTELFLDDYGIHTVYPAQRPIVHGEVFQEADFQFDELRYGDDEYAFESIAQIRVLGTMRGYRIGLLTVSPVFYNPAQKSLSVCNDIELEVVFENADHAATQTLYRSTFSPYFEKIAKNFFNRSVYDDHPDLYKTPVHMLVVANKMFEESLQPWIEWKTKKGFYVDLHYTDEIGTTAAAIKAFCHQKYQDGAANNSAPTFLVLVGDTEQLPAGQHGAATGKVTDLYYASVDDDYFPEMYYSRMSAETLPQLDNIIEKTLSYEQYLFERPELLDEIIFATGVEGNWQNLMGRMQAQYAIDHYFTEEKGFDAFHCFDGYCSVMSFLSYDLWAHYSGYCTDTLWAFPEFGVSAVEGLDNDNSYPITVANCNLSSNFEHDLCMGEAMTRAQKKGSAAYIGSAANTYWNENFYFVVGAFEDIGNNVIPTPENSSMGFYDALFDENAFNSLSSSVFAGNLAVTFAVENGYALSMTTGNSAQYYWEAYNVLGDGSISPFLGQAADNHVSHSLLFPKNSAAYSVSASPGSYVAISKAGVLLGTAVVPAGGTANVALSNPVTTDGAVDIVVTKSQYKPYIAQIPAGPATGPFIVYENHETVGEDFLHYLSVDVDISVEIKNLGFGATSAPLTVTVACSDPQLTINQATAQYGAMASGEVKSAVFNVTVDHKIPNEKEFILQATASNTQGSWNFEIPLIAYAPVLELEKILVDGVVNGSFAADTTVVISAVVRNSGRAAAYEVKGTVAVDDPYLTIFCEYEPETAGDLESGESRKYTFAVESAATLPENYTPNVDISLAGAYEIAAVLPLFMEKGDYEKPGYTNCMANDKFRYVALGGMENPDDACTPDGYADYTHLTAAELVWGDDANELWIHLATKGACVRYWIDYNHNNIFEDHEVSSYSYHFGGIGLFDWSFSISDDALPGETRLRLRLRHSYYVPDPYSGYDFGQTHDYTVIIPERFERAQHIAATANASNSVLLTWDAPETDAPIGYNLYRNGKKVNPTPITNRTFTESYLSKGLYIYSVAAVYKVGDEDKESLEIFAPPLCLDDVVYLCNPPDDFTSFPNFPAMTVLFSWKRPSEFNDLISGYNIYRNGVKINSELLQELSYFDSGLEKKKYEYYTTVSYKNCEESEPSNKIILDFESGTNISDIAADNFKIYPNPASNSVVFEGDGLSKIELFDLRGRLLATYEGFENEFVLKNLNIFAEGVYLVKMYSGDGQFLVKRLTVAR